MLKFWLCNDRSQRTICTEVRLCMKYRSCIDWMSMVVVVSTLFFNFIIIWILEGRYVMVCGALYVAFMCRSFSSQHICLSVELCHPVPLTSCGKSWFWISDRELGLLWGFGADLLFFFDGGFYWRILSGFQLIKVLRKYGWGCVYMCVCFSKQW